MRYNAPSWRRKRATLRADGPAKISNICRQMRGAVARGSIL
jgi:hypothetical protein